MTTRAILWFDGQSAQTQSAQLERAAETLLVHTVGRPDVVIQVSNMLLLTDVTAPKPVLGAPLGGYAVLRSASDLHALVPEVLAGGRAQHQLPSWRTAAAALLGAIALVILLSGWIVPKAADVAGAVIPWSAEIRLGTELLRRLDAVVLKPSTLEGKQQIKIAGRFSALAELAELDGARIVFRASNSLGPNAFALPGRIVIVTDELVEALGVTPRLDAVLAHELGHVQQRHAARSVLSRAGFALVIGAVLHDDSLVSKAAAEMPSGLLTAAHSRDAEREADAFAFALLRKSGSSPAAFGEALEAMQQRTKVRQDGPSYLGTHPSSQERIDAAKNAR
jgi:predicted Zn-dependent protease